MEIIVNKSSLEDTKKYFAIKQVFKAEKIIKNHWQECETFKTASNFFIIKKKDDDEYVSHNDDNTSRFGGYSITQNKNGAAKFSTKRDAIEIINRYNLELNLMSELEVVNF